MTFRTADHMPSAAAVIPNRYRGTDVHVFSVRSRSTDPASSLSTNTNAPFPLSKVNTSTVAFLIALRIVALMSIPLVVRVWTVSLIEAFGMMPIHKERIVMFGARTPAVPVRLYGRTLVQCRCVDRFPFGTRDPVRSRVVLRGSPPDEK